HHVSKVKFHFDKSMMVILKKLLEYDFPFQEQSIMLAFDMYEDSYEAKNQILAFLSLMISMETLFNPKERGEVTHKISRNCAVLLGKDKEDSDKIFKQIKKIYEARSQIVHSGKTSKFKRKYMLIIRDYIRRSIVKMLDLNEEKEEILRKLNTLGFGEIGKYNQVILE
ncbi:hypothetical protein ACFL0D_08440, partial [Thermoproteota archaeon]